MKTLRCLLISVISLGALQQASADESQTASHPNKYPIELSIDVGPWTGLGAAVAWRPFDHFGLRAGVHWADMSMPNFEYELDEGGSTGNFDLDALYKSAHLTLDYYPFAKRSFRISAGIFANQNEFTLEASGAIDIDGTTYNNEQVNTEVEWDKIMPYIAIGGDLFYFDKAHRWAMGMEFGIAFGDAPTVIVSNPTGGVAQSDLNSLQQDFEDVFEDLKIWPVLKLSLSFKF